MKRNLVFVGALLGLLALHAGIAAWCCWNPAGAPSAASASLGR